MEIRMTNPTVKNFAIELKMPPQALLDLLKSAGVLKESFKDHISGADKTELLDHLRSTRTSAGVMSAPKLTRVSVGKRNLKSIQLRTQTQFEFDTPTVIS
jgi:hypothetical protein